MQQLMRKMGQRMIMVLIIALLLVNFVICNSVVKAAGSDDNDEEGDEADIGGILFRPIASLICGIGDTFNTLLQRLIINDKSDVFISRRIFLRF